MADTLQPPLSVCCHAENGSVNLSFSSGSHSLGASLSLARLSSELHNSDNLRIVAEVEDGEYSLVVCPISNFSEKI